MWANITIQRTERGKWRGNKKADSLAKKAVNEVLKFKNYNKNYTEKISTKRMKNLLKKELGKLNNIQLNSKKRKSIISINMETWGIYKKSYKLKKDLKLISFMDLPILTPIKNGTHRFKLVLS